MEKQRGGSLWLVLGLVALPILYVLSAGPVIYYMERTNADPIPAVNMFYTPLGWACRHGLDKPFFAYADFWIRLANGRPGP